MLFGLTERWTHFNSNGMSANKCCCNLELLYRQVNWKYQWRFYIWLSMYAVHGIVALTVSGSRETLDESAPTHSQQRHVQHLTRLPRLKHTQGKAVCFTPSGRSETEWFYPVRKVWKGMFYPCPEGVKRTVLPMVLLTYIKHVCRWRLRQKFNIKPPGYLSMCIQRRVLRICDRYQKLMN